MNLRQLKKRDKRAAVILLALYRHIVSPNGFGLGDDGRYHYEWRCSYEYDEWDWRPASEFLSDMEDNDYLCDCIDPSTGEMLPDDRCPPVPPSAMRELPAGYRWRGGRVVPVDKFGAMVRTQKKNGRAR